MESGSNRGDTVQKETQRSHSGSAPPPGIDCANSVHSTGVPRAGPSLALTMSVPRSMQRMVMVPRGRGMPRMMNSRKGVISGMLLVRV